jgi:excisionase family DNA binding protein
MTEIWISRDEVAAMLDVHPKTIERYVRQGKIPAYHVGPMNHTRFKKSEIDAIMTPRPYAAGE